MAILEWSATLSWTVAFIFFK